MDARNHIESVVGMGRGWATSSNRGQGPGCSELVIREGGSAGMGKAAGQPGICYRVSHAVIYREVTVSEILLLETESFGAKPALFMELI